MRLIDTWTLELREFLPDSIPKYAILSHTWGSEEVSFAQFTDPQSRTTAGFQKIQSACRHAQMNRLDYLWVDTCCIDKQSSAELSEAINSMYHWYKRSEMCFAYLEDVRSHTRTSGSESPVEPSLERDSRTIQDRDSPRCRFKTAGTSTPRWFTRGWTLQELLAPRDLLFFDTEWRLLGSKESLSAEIAEITGIDRDYITYRKPLEAASVSERFSWFAHSNRTCSRPEDVAYSLMGLFDVNMPLLYGEGGEKAFIRLQEAIIKSSDDQTIFAWTLPQSRTSANTENSETHGLLAKSPNYFKHSGSFRSAAPHIRSKHAEVTSRGILVNVFLSRTPGPKSQDIIYTATLACVKLNQPNRFASIRLKESQSGSGQYVRVLATNLMCGVPQGVKETVCVSGAYKELKFRLANSMLDGLVHRRLRLNYMRDDAFKDASMAEVEHNDHSTLKNFSTDCSPTVWRGVLRAELDNLVKHLPLFTDTPLLRFGLKLTESLWICVQIGTDQVGQVGYCINAGTSAVDFATFKPKSPLHKHVHDKWTAANSTTTTLGCKIYQIFTFKHPDIKCALHFWAPDVNALRQGDVCNVDMMLKASDQVTGSGWQTSYSHFGTYNLVNKIGWSPK